MNLLLVNLLLVSILLSTPVKSGQNQFKCEFNSSNISNLTQGVYTIYDREQSILHVLSFVGTPTFLIYNTTSGPGSLNYAWNHRTGVIGNVSISNYDLLYGFVVRNLIEFKVASANIDFDINGFDKSNQTSLFKTYSLSNLTYNLTGVEDCDKTGKIQVSLQQKNDSNCTHQFNFIFNIQAHKDKGRLSNKPRYSFQGNNSIIDFTINNFTYTLTDGDTPSSRLALELDFIKINDSELSYSSVKNIDDEYTPAVFEQNNIQTCDQPDYFYWKPISYADSGKSVESSMIVTYLNGTTNYTVDLNTTGFFHSLQYSCQQLALERSFFLFGTDGDSHLNPNYVFFRAELGIGQLPTDAISLPLIIAIGIGFGLPVLGLILGMIGICVFMVYKCCCRISARNSRYVMIN